MSDRELEHKFRDQATTVITGADTDALLKAIGTLDETRLRGRPVRLDPHRRARRSSSHGTA